MSAEELDLDDLQRRMNGALSVLKTELSGLRTGRASIALVEPITVEAYGQSMPINQVGTVSVPEPRMLSIQVWDKGMVSAVEKAIRESNIGINPVVDGQLLRLPIPEMNQERRQEMVKVAHSYAEGAKVAIRHVRRDGMEMCKKAEKDGMSEDEAHIYQEEIQELTDKAVKDVDEMLAVKEQDIMQV
ncbi:ribosome recycling factor [Cohaesibacter gelatinilyticus]|uniref:Ribosome-recycling factor n=1 Tax=Cohaesibacter gelatinilyticus TaxID=372072 RepID=A0A285NF18_9HYPH|nr:ribosome recycling factor [Cohaesibacter gelatinilyticus]SNZ07868.1 ribosome recycling factor [Cohaesibacter gelatinilyticus]HAT87627.1 ribosome recycling factor [Hyphomicrobiales bacterium]